MARKMYFLFPVCLHIKPESLFDYKKLICQFVYLFDNLLTALLISI